MIVQDNPSGPDRFVMTMTQHTAFADKLAEQFGNDRFAKIDNPSVRYVIANHDAGWRPVDQGIPMNPETGLPYHLGETPFEFTSQTMRGSPDFNAQHSDLAGLISSMHTAGLLNGRYGLAPPGLLARFEGEKKAIAEQVLADELARQAQLKTKLNIAESHIWTAYKQLQFFDMLSLYFHSTAEGVRGVESFPDVPTRTGDDLTLYITEHNKAVYVLDPYPFADATVSVSFEGRWMTPIEPAQDGRAVFESLPISVQTVTLQPA